jgi:uncharacterized protein (TIGR02646 family)
VIRIIKPSKPPEVLRKKGALARRSHCRAYSRRPKRYREGAESFEFDASIYAHDSVREALLVAQHGKCAFCESKVTHIAYGDVEHFRPKAGWRQMESDPLQRPGYYWLAYEWTNLFMACTLCNQRFKRNLFPLRAPGKRARSHKDDVTAEKPLLVDPARDDPEGFISFREEVPYAVNGNARGESTIKILGLKREALAESRRDHLNRVKALCIIAALKVPEADEAKATLLRLRRGSEPYASMTRAFLD